MKKTNIFLSLMLLVLSVFTACDSNEGELYQGEENKVSFLASSTNVSMTGDYIQVPVGRTSSQGELTVPVSLSATLYDAKGENPYPNPGYTDAFKVIGDVKFESGESKAYALVDYANFASVDPTDFTITPDGFDVGVSLGFPFELTIHDDLLSPSERGEAKIVALNKLEFEDAGKGTIDSEEGWTEEEEPFEVSYQKAKGVNAYKVIKPFSDYNIAFLIGSDGKTVTFPKQVISPNATYGPISIEVSKATYDPETHSVTATVSGYTVAAGSFGPGVEVFYLPGESFQ